MGEAKRRGSFEERKTQAIIEGRDSWKVKRTRINERNRLKAEKARRIAYMSLGIN